MFESELKIENGMKNLRVFYDANLDNFEECIKLAKVKHKISKDEPVAILCLPMKLK